MVAVSNGMSPYNFFPSPRESSHLLPPLLAPPATLALIVQALPPFIDIIAVDTFQCYAGVGIPGNVIQTNTNIPDRTSCSRLCLANAQCQMFVYDNWKACRLFTAPFSTGGSIKNPNFEASCISITKGSE